MRSLVRSVSLRPSTVVICWSGDCQQSFKICRVLRSLQTSLRIRDRDGDRIVGRQAGSGSNNLARWVAACAQPGERQHNRNDKILRHIVVDDGFQSGDSAQWQAGE